jgi:hypothetical protein
MGSASGRVFLSVLPDGWVLPCVLLRVVVLPCSAQQLAVDDTVGNADLSDGVYPRLGQWVPVGTSS